MKITTRANLGSLLTLFASTLCLNAEWEYRTSEDPMGRGVTKLAQVRSNDSSHEATLTIRQGPGTQWIPAAVDRDVTLELAHGQLTAYWNQFGGWFGMIVVRFDDQKANEDFSLAMPETGERNHAKLVPPGGNYADFLAKLRKAKRLRIQVNVMPNSAALYDFDVAGLKWTW